MKTCRAIDCDRHSRL